MKSRLLAIAILISIAGIPTARAVPNTPGSLKAVPGGPVRIDLKWQDASDSELGFTVERSADGLTGWTALGQVGPDQTAYTDTSGLASRTRYFYRVAAFDGSGQSAWSNVTWALTVYRGKPLSDWLNVKTDGCGGPAERPCAVGDGIADDTEALQRAINSLKGAPGSRTPHVLYFPNGTYRISDTLTMEGQFGIQFVGESTDGVVILWSAGAAGGTKDSTGLVTAKPMFLSEGNRYCTYRNITWDANNVPYVIAVDHAWCGNSANPDVGGYNPECDAIPANPWFPGLARDVGWSETLFAHFDSVFKNAWIGIRLNHYSTSVEVATYRRCRFLDNEVGVSLEDDNTSEHSFWDCEFRGNRYYGIVNYMDDLEGDGTREGNGNDAGGTFRILRGRFRENGRDSNPPGSIHKRADIGYLPGGQISVRDSWSKNSGQFVYGEGANQTSRQMSILGCQVDDFDPLGNHDGRAISILNSGTALVVDNIIDSAGRTEPVYHEVGPSPAKSDLLALHNSYTTDDPYGPDDPNPGFKRRTIDDRLIPPFDLQIPPLPAAADPLQGRPIYTVTDENNVQEVIDAASADAEAAVVHFPSGRYVLAGTIRVPAGSDLLIAGNGPTTLLVQGGQSSPMLEIDGHRVDGLTIRDLGFEGKSGSANIPIAILARDLNQEASRVLVNRFLVAEALATPPATSGIDVDGCDRVKVDVMDTVVCGTKGSDNSGMVLKAGPQPQVGTTIWTGFFSANNWDLDVTNGLSGVKLLVHVYAEHSQHYLRARGDAGRGDISIHCGQVQTREVVSPLTTNAISLEDFSGNVSLVNSTMFNGDPANQGARIEQTGDAPVGIQLMGNTIFWDSEFVVAPGTRVIRTNEKYNCLQGSKDGTINGCDAASGPAYVPLPDLDCVGSSCAPYDDAAAAAGADALLDEGLSLLRSSSIPGFYDEAGASETYQLNIDNVQVRQCGAGLVLQGGIPGAPISLTAVCDGGTSISLAWQSDPLGSAPEDGFTIERSSSPGGPFAQLANVGPGVTSFADQNLPEWTEHFYRVGAFRSRTGSSGPSSVASAVSGISSPTGLAARLRGRAKVLLSWNDTSGVEDGYIIERSTGSPDSFRVLAVIPAPDVESYVDRSGLSPWIAYFYRVRAYKGAVSSPPSNVSSVSTRNDPLPFLGSWRRQP